MTAGARWTEADAAGSALAMPCESTSRIPHEGAWHRHFLTDQRPWGSLTEFTFQVANRTGSTIYGAWQYRSGRRVQGVAPVADDGAGRLAEHRVQPRPGPIRPSTVRVRIDRPYRSDDCRAASMGIYPENLGTADVTLHAPLFTQVLIHLDSGNTLTINAPQASSSNFYIQSLTVNGTPSTKTWLPGSMFTTGGTVNFTLGSSPSTWGTGAGDVPPAYEGPGTPTTPPPAPPPHPV